MTDDSVDSFAEETASIHNSRHERAKARVQELQTSRHLTSSDHRVTIAPTSTSTNTNNNNHRSNNVLAEKTGLMREFRFKLGGEDVSFNPIVTFATIIILWSLVFWTIADPTRALSQLLVWRGKITLNCTWFFILFPALRFFFLLFIVFRFGNIKLGGNDPKNVPEFAPLSYFAMILASGVAVGLFVYGTSEPLWHQASHAYANAGYHTQDEIDMYAINLTVSHWGIMGWTDYVVVALAMGLLQYNLKLPFTFRSVFVPILGDYAFGWMGDMIDTITIVVTITGIGTSLGLGAMHIVTGFQYMEWIESIRSVDRLTAIQNVVVWWLTVCSALSVISGVYNGIRILSVVAVVTGSVLTFVIFCLDDTKYLLNLQVQEIGYYLQHSILELEFFTDTFGQLRANSGRAIDGKSSEEWWMDSWRVFYMAWWMSWSAFVGMFVARISRGRTISEVVGYSLVAPIVYCLYWFCTWGGIAIRQSRQGMELEQIGLEHFDDASYFSVSGSEHCYNVPQEDVWVNGTLVFTNYNYGVTPVCKFDGEGSKSSFDVLYSFSFPDSLSTGLGPTLSFISLMAISIFFVTSSDSASLAVYYSSSNGRSNYHWTQLLFWSITQGALASALLRAGGSDALKTVQAASILCGVIINTLLCFTAQSIWLFCLKCEGEFDTVKDGEPLRYRILTSDRYHTQREFTTPLYGGLFNVIEFLFSFGKVHEKRKAAGMDMPTLFHCVEFVRAVFLPFSSLHLALNTAYPKNVYRNTINTMFYTFLYISWIALFCYTAKAKSLHKLAMSIFCICGITLGSFRNGIRRRYNIRSTLVGDIVGSTFLWPQVLMQLRELCIENYQQGIEGDEMKETV